MTEQIRCTLAVAVLVLSGIGAARAAITPGALYDFRAANNPAHPIGFSNYGTLSGQLDVSGTVPTLTLAGNGDFAHYDVQGAPGAFDKLLNAKDLAIDNGFSYEMFVRRTGNGFGSTEHQIAAAMEGDAGTIFFELNGFGSGGTNSSIDVLMGGVVKRDIIPLPQDIWTHFVFTFDDVTNQGKVYVNGGAPTTMTIPGVEFESGSNSSSAVTLFKVRGSENDDRRFDGDIAIARFYDFVLDPNQAMGNFDALHDRVWRLDGIGDWNALVNWDGGSPNADVHNAVFGSTITQPRTVYTNTDVTAKTVTFDNANGYTIGGGGTVNLQSGSGDAEINVGQGSHQFQTELNLLSNLEIEVASSASLTLQNRVDFGNSSVTKTDVGTLAIKSNLNTGSGTIDVQAGTLMGGGTVAGSVMNTGGILAPGSSPGVMTITGSYDQQAAAMLQIEIGGTTAGTEYDVLDAAGSANLAGILDVQLIDLGSGVYAPIAGDSFEVLTAGSLNGTFSGGISLPSLTGMLSWNVNYDTVGDRVLLEVSSPFTADFDGDGDVDSDDLALWEGDYSVNDGSDANGDGRSDGLDFLAWQRQFTGELSPVLQVSSVVPEPSSSAMFLLATYVITLYRNHG